MPWDALNRHSQSHCVYKRALCRVRYPALLPILQRAASGLFLHHLFTDVQNASPAFSGLLHLQDFLNHGSQFRTASGLENLLVNQRAFLIIPIPFALDIGPGLYEVLRLPPGHDGTHHNLGGVYRNADCPVGFEFWY